MSDSRSSPRWMPVLSCALVFCAFFLATVALQVWGGAYRNELGGHPDESAHYVTGLMVHDYLHELRPLHPLKYAQDYYEHYPKVALGHWPPFFYGLQAVWMTVCGTSRTSALALSAAITACLATLCWSILKPRYGWPTAVALGVLCVCMPLVVTATQSVMADVLIAALCLLAAILLGRYFDSGRALWSLAFGAVAAFALLTKSTGAPLALLPGLAVLFGRRWDVLRRPAFWASAVVVSVLCGPWYVLTWRMASNGLNPAGETVFDKLNKLGHIGRDAYVGFGPVILILAAVGLGRLLRRRDPVNGVSLCVLSLGPAVVLFILLTPLVTEQRYLLSVLPTLLLLAGAGLAQLTEIVPHAAGGLRNWLAPAAALAAFAATTFYVPEKTCRGYEQLAEFLQSHPEFNDSLIVINSDAVGEGMAIAELAESRPLQQRTVVRSSKLLRTSRWDNSDYQLLYDSPARVQEALTHAPIGIAVLDRGVPQKRLLPHNAQLEEAIKAHPNQWRQVAHFPGVRAGGGGEIEVYELIGHQQLPKHGLELDMRHSFDGGIRVEAGAGK